jgi:hypothetical protein
MFYSRFRYIDAVVVPFSFRWLSASHISIWAWNKLFYWHSKILILTLTFTLKLYNGGRLKSKVYVKHEDFTFPIINFAFNISNISALPAYVDYLYSDILESAQLQMAHLLKQATLLLWWGHRYTHLTVVITNWLTVAKYSYFKWKLTFCCMCRVFLSATTDTVLCYICNMLDILYEIRTAFPSGTPGFTLGRERGYVCCLLSK